MKLKKLAQVVSLICIAAPAFAQTPADKKDDKPEVKVEKIEVTGSSIKRVADEGAVPIQVIRAADLVKLGISNAEQLLASISANGNGTDNLASNQGGDFLNSLGSAKYAHNNGASGASLRGLGPGYTLVLLNGRRVSTHGLNGSSVDLNTIPLEAMDRVEILKDGASAIYGTDAIGGVINFILKKDYRGIEVSTFGDVTQHKFGNIYRTSVLAGVGDLATDRYNLMAALSYSTNGRLRGSQRDFQNGYQPDKGLAPDTTGTPYANIGVAGGTALSSGRRVSLLALQGKCTTITDQSPYRGDITGFNNNNDACAYDYGKQWSLIQPVDRTNIVSRGTIALAPEHNLFAEVVGSRVKSAVEYTPIQINNQNYPAFILVNGLQTRSPYYQDLTGLVAGFDNTKPERIRWRCLPCGPRQQNTSTDAYRGLVGADGIVAGWDYKVGLSTAQSKATTVLGDGNMITDKINAAITSGIINPFLLPGQSQTQAATDAINAAKATGFSLYGGQANTKQFDGNISKEIFKLPAGFVAAAVGFDLRKEEYRFREDQDNQPAILGVTAPASLAKVDRKIKAIYGELQIPVIKDLDVQLAARYDKYSDVGSTTNPKVAIRWQPVQMLGFRSSYSTGFHAPDFDDLYGGDTTGQFNSDINDPVLCPNGGTGVGCGIRPTITGKSNPNLKPEKSKQFSIGVLVQPTPWLSASVDFWNIKITDRVSALSGQLLVSRYTQYQQYITRDPVTREITDVSSPTFNLAGDKTNGLDLNVTGSWKTDIGNITASIDGTYTNSFKSRFSEADSYVERVGQFGDTTYGFALHVRWKHAAKISWEQGPWTATLSQNFTGGYSQEKDGYGSGFTPASAPDRTSSYTLYNLLATYKGVKNLTVTAGIKNLFDTKPPYSSHNVDNVSGAGWDARVGDPRLRSFILSLNYKFF